MLKNIYKKLTANVTLNSEHALSFHADQKQGKDVPSQTLIQHSIKQLSQPGKKRRGKKETAPRMEGIELSLRALPGMAARADIPKRQRGPRKPGAAQRGRECQPSHTPQVTTGIRMKNTMPFSLLPAKWNTYV